MDLTVHRHHLICVSVREVPMWCNNSRCFRRLIMSLMPAHSKSTNLDIFLVQKMRIVCDSCFDAFVKINVLDKTKHVLWKHTQMCIWYISHINWQLLISPTLRGELIGIRMLVSIVDICSLKYENYGFRV